MSPLILAQPITVPHDIEYAAQYLEGKDLWAAGKRLSACTTDAQREGWPEADAKGLDAYLRYMPDTAPDGEEVDWDSVGEIIYDAYGDRVLSGEVKLPWSL